MTILQFPIQPTIDPRRAELIQLAAELGALILWPDEAPGQPILTHREQSVLACMDMFLARSAMSIAVELGIDYSWICVVCRNLSGKGLAVRTKRGWVKCSGKQSRCAA